MLYALHRVHLFFSESTLDKAELATALLLLLLLKPDLLLNFRLVDATPAVPYDGSETKKSGDDATGQGTDSFRCPAHNDGVRAKPNRVKLVAGSKAQNDVHLTREVEHLCTAATHSVTSGRKTKHLTLVVVDLRDSLPLLHHIRGFDEHHGETR